MSFLEVTQHQFTDESIQLSAKTLISVIIPAYNAEQTLNETLASLHAQTYNNWEAIIVNDGSTDKTSQLAHQWSQTDSRIQVINQKNIGLGGARNAALKVAKGKFVHCLDSDDLIEPDFYEQVMQALSKISLSDLPGICAVCSFQMFTNVGQPLGTPFVPKAENFQFHQLAQGNFGPPVTYIFERSILELTGTFDETLRHCHDWDLWLRFARISVNFIVVPEVKALYRISSNSLSRNYNSYIEVAAKILQRLSDKDLRCSLIQPQFSSLSQEVIETGLVRFWIYNILRAASSYDQSGLNILFSWAKQNLPDSFWKNPSSYKVDLHFRWVEAKPDISQAFENEIEYRIFYLDTLKKSWLGQLPTDILICNLQGIRAVILTSRQLPRLQHRFRLMRYLLLFNSIQAWQTRNYLSFWLTLLNINYFDKIKTITGLIYKVKKLILSAKYYIKKLITLIFSKNPYQVASFKSLYPPTDFYPDGIRTHQPNINQILREEPGEIFRVEQANIITPTESLKRLNPPSYLTTEPTRRLFSLAQGGVYGEDGIIYDTQKRCAIAETVEHWNLPITQNPSLALPRFPPAQHLSGITCDLAGYAGQTFYHFLIEILPKIYFLKDILPHCDRIIVPRYGESWKQRWLEFIGVKQPIIWRKALAHYHCDQLLFTNRLVRHFEPNTWAIHALRKLVNIEQYQSEKPDKFLFASRKGYRKRQVSWGEELPTHLPEFKEIELGQFNPATSIEFCGKTRAFVGFHGAAFSNLVFCPPGCHVVEILVSDEEMWYSRLSAICGHKHTCIRVADPNPDLNKLAEKIRQLVIDA